MATTSGGISQSTTGGQPGKICGRPPTASWFADTFGFTEHDDDCSGGGGGYVATQQRLREMQTVSSDPSRALVRWLSNKEGGGGDGDLLPHQPQEHEVIYGDFDTPTVIQLREECRRLLDYLAPNENNAVHPRGSIKFKWENIQANVLELHADESN